MSHFLSLTCHWLPRWRCICRLASLRPPPDESFLASFIMTHYHSALFFWYSLGPCLCLFWNPDPPENLALQRLPPLLRRENLPVWWASICQHLKSSKFHLMTYIIIIYLFSNVSVFLKNDIQWKKVMSMIIKCQAWLQSTLNHQSQMKYSWTFQEIVVDQKTSFKLISTWLKMVPLGQRKENCWLGTIPQTWKT